MRDERGSCVLERTTLEIAAPFEREITAEE
jgi:hypothetical protein